MALDLTKINSMDTNIKSETLTKSAAFIITSDKAVLPKPVVVDEKDPVELKPDEVDAREDLELESQIDMMVARWLRTSKNVVVKEDQDELKVLAKKMYYERLKTGDSRVIWRVLKEYITGVKSEIF